MTLRFQTSRPVHATQDAVWSVLGDFGHEHRWTTSLAHCERDAAGLGIGTARAALAPPARGADGRRSLRGKADGGTLATAEGRFGRAASSEAWPDLPSLSSSD